MEQKRITAYEAYAHICKRWLGHDAAPEGEVGRLGDYTDGQSYFNFIEITESSTRDFCPTDALMIRLVKCWGAADYDIRDDVWTIADVDRFLGKWDVDVETCARSMVLNTLRRHGT